MGLYFVLTISRFWNWNEEIVVYEQELVNLQIRMLVFGNACQISTSYGPLIWPHNSMFLNWNGMIVGYEQELVNLQIWMLIFQNACQMSSSYKPLTCPRKWFRSFELERSIVGFEQELLFLQI